MILFPALGLPAIANDGVIDVIALVKKDSNLLKPAPAEGPEKDETVKQRIVERIVESLRYVAWSDKDETFDSAKEIEPKWIEDLTWVSVTKSEEKPLTYKIEFEDPLHQLTLRISDLVLKKFDSIYETTIMLRFHIKLADGEGLYNLVTLFDESSFVRGILKGLTSPSHAHRTDTSGNILPTRAGKDIKVYHPFLITTKSILNIAHAADIHVSTHWELYERVCATENIVGKGVYNNYNTRFKDILEDINKRAGADIAIITGDLIDYNRGHMIDFASDKKNTYKGNRNFVDDYLFNRNWILFYELLIENYEKPVFTLLGNHEYLLNPYPPVVDFQVETTATVGPVRLRIGSETVDMPGVEFGIRWNGIMRYFWNISTRPLPFAGDMNLTDGELSKIDGVQKSQIGMGDAGKLMELRALKDEGGLARLLDSMPEFKKQLRNSDGGIWYTCEEAVLWYFLVINPFKDYTFSHKEMAFLMVDWNVGQDKGTVLLLPRPSKCLSPEQMRMVDELGSKNAKYRVFCSHAPVLDPWPELGNFYLAKARKKGDHDEIEEYPFLKHDSTKFNWGALEEKSRKELINKILKFPIHLCLNGHSHTSKVFQIKENSEGKKLVFLRTEEDPGSWDPKLPVMVITTSGGPIGRTSEVSEWDNLTPPGYRVVSFDKGQISTEMIDMNVSIRSLVTHDAVKNDPYHPPGPSKLKRWLKIHEIDRIELPQTFSSSLPSSRIPDDHSVLIDEISGRAAKINKLDDGRTIMVKKIPRGATLTINGNDGTIIVQRNEGWLVINDNDDIINVDENRGWIFIFQNDDTIIIHENGRPGGSSISGHVVIYSNGTGSPGDDVVRVYDNFGTVGIYNKYKRLDGTIVKTPGNDDLVAVRRNSGMFNVGYNDDTVEIGVNSKFVDIYENTGGPLEVDSDIFIFKNERKVTFHGNEGDIHVFDNSAGELNVRGNSRTIKVSSGSKKGNITGAKKRTVTSDSESDVRSRFEDREQDQKPTLE